MNLKKMAGMTSPWDERRVAPPGQEEMAQLGIKPESDEKAVSVSTKIRPALLYVIDRIIERRVYTHKSRQDVFRAALQNYVEDLEEEIQDDNLTTLLHRLTMQRRLYAQVLQMSAAAEMLALVKKNVQIWVLWGNRFEAVKVLREAKRFMEELPFDLFRERFKFTLYGDPKGEAIPDHWEDMPSAVLWHEVLQGDLDRNNEVEMQQEMKLR